jgi:hypothetical protein
VLLLWGEDVEADGVGEASRRLKGLPVAAHSFVGLALAFEQFGSSQQGQ